MNSSENYLTYKIFTNILKCSARLHLFDKNYNKNSNYFLFEYNLSLIAKLVFSRL